MRFVPFVPFVHSDAGVRVRVVFRGRADAGAPDDVGDIGETARSRCSIKPAARRATSAVAAGSAA
ncbi:hypothetical protein WI23_07050 [Burkholderia oklahomensis C6786]|nr:hypothetical protein WI23_07050 [Burkholderia oklahomensis C6786]KUY59267.1 hypothetical protein WI23_01130 [Burkholderia oklahomensis C6786]